MDKKELKSICDTLSSKIVDKNNSKEQMEKDLSIYSKDGKTISNAGMMAYCMNKSMEYTNELIYNVLCEVLDVKD